MRQYAIEINDENLDLINFINGGRVPFPKTGGTRYYVFDTEPDFKERIQIMRERKLVREHECVFRTTAFHIE